MRTRATYEALAKGERTTSKHRRDHDAARAAYEAALYAQALAFFKSRIRTVEIAWNGALHRVFFKRPNVTKCVARGAMHGLR